MTVVVLLGLLGVFIPSATMACEQSTVVDCGPGVPDATYQGGGVEVDTVLATACFTSDILTAITLSNGSYNYTADFVYNPSLGSHEVIKTVYTQPCWTHNVAIGTWMAVYVTCLTYRGWVAVQITAPGTYTMVRVPWTFEEKIG